MLSKTLNMMMANPMLFVPQLVTLVFTLASTLLFRFSPLNPLGFLVSIASLALGIIVSGAYPFMVKDVIEGRPFSIGDAFGKAWVKFWSLLAASILIAIIVVLGFIAIVVPGIIFITWYAYTIPAIMLDNKGALDGMAASKVFGHDKKWATFIMIIAVLVGYIVVSILAAFFGPVLGGVVNAILSALVGAWLSVIISYTYITHGPSSLLPPAGMMAGMAPMGAGQQPGMQTAGAAPSSFCPNCGSPLEPGAKFCRNCGKPV